MDSNKLMILCRNNYALLHMISLVDWPKHVFCFFLHPDCALLAVLGWCPMGKIGRHGRAHHCDCFNIYHPRFIGVGSLSACFHGGRGNCNLQIKLTSPLAIGADCPIH